MQVNYIGDVGSAAEPLADGDINAFSVTVTDTAGTASVSDSCIQGLDQFDPSLLRDNPFYIAYLLAISFGFYGWFWTHGGQTLGMRAWRLKALTADGQAVSWRHAIIRVAAAHVSLFALGLGYLWLLIDREKLKGQFPPRTRAKRERKTSLVPTTPCRQE